MFKDLIGNISVKETLEELFNSKNISHSYIFSGIEGIGKQLFAKEFLKNIMCLKNGKCDEKCDSCIKFNSNNNPDFTLIEPEGKVIKIEKIRKMQERIAEKPIISNKKAYLINNADLMTEESQNCLLKTLEEPPKYAIIVLIVANENKLLQTIKSRCIRIKFNRLKDEELKDYLKELPEEKIKLLDGSLKNVSLIDEKQEEYEEAIKIVKIIKDGSLLNLLENSEMLYNKKENIMEILDYLNIILFENRIVEPIEIIEKTKRKIINNNNYEMSIDYMLINSWKSIHEQS